jgi:hypothetical protein
MAYVPAAVPSVHRKPAPPLDLRDDAPLWWAREWHECQQVSDIRVPTNGGRSKESLNETRRWFQPAA